MYSVKFMTDQEFETLPYKTSDASGVCDRNSKQIYVRSTGVNAFDAMTAMHEIKHMEEGDWDKFRSHEDPDNPGVYYKGVIDWIQNLVPAVGAIMGNFQPMIQTAAALTGSNLGSIGSGLSETGSNIANGLSQINPSLGGAAASIGGALGNVGNAVGNVLGIGGGNGSSNVASGYPGGSTPTINVSPWNGTYGMRDLSTSAMGSNAIGSASPEFGTSMSFAPSSGAGSAMSGFGAGASSGASAGMGSGLASAIGAGLGAGAGGMMAGGPTSSVSNDFSSYGSQGGQQQNPNQQNQDQNQQFGQTFATTPWSVSGLNTYGDQNLQNSPLGYIGKDKEQQQQGSDYQGFMSPDQRRAGF